MRVRPLDAQLAGLLLTASLIQVLVQPIAARPVGVAIALFSCLPVAFRHTQPIAAALVGSLIWLVPSDGYLYLGYVAALLVFYSLGTEIADWRLVAAVSGLACAIGVLTVALRHEILGEAVGAVIVVLAPVGVGRVVRHHRDQQRRLEELALHLERERERGARAAVAEERTRIARELHDVVAHGVSVIAIQSDAAEAALDHDPALARQPLEAIRGSARDALTEMRRMLGALRSEDDPSGVAPQPGLAQLPELIERAGVPVALEIGGDPRPLPAGVDISAYRILQEALTNVRKHAEAAATTVRIAWTDDRLELTVRDEGPGPREGISADGGHGLLGMGERVRLLGGELHTGAAPAGGFEVRAVLPV